LKLSPSQLIREIRCTIDEESGVGTTLRKISRIRKRDPFKVLIATILSQRTRDENTDRAAEQLFGMFPSARALARAPLRTVERLIRPAGFYHVKAKKIKEVAEIVTKRYGGAVPRDLESLLELPLVGRKTANCVLVYGFGKAAIPVDTHVHRISNRLGIVDAETPEQTEHLLSRFFEKKHWIEVNEIMVRFGKTICRPIGPRCSACRLTRHCTYFHENRKHGSPLHQSRPSE